MISFIHSAWTILVFVIFIAIVIWAWSGKRKQSFDRASRIPLEDDDSGINGENNSGDTHA